MVFRFMGLWGIIMLLLPLCALADEIVIPLPIISPDFPECSETVVFQVDLPMDAVTQISLHLEGTFQEVLYVNVANPGTTGTRPAYLDIYLAGSESVGWEVSDRHQFPAGAGPFDFNVILMSREMDDWSSLSNGAGRIGLECGPAYIQGPSGQIASAGSSWGIVTTASLILSYDPALPAEGWTWEAVKAVYR